MPIIGFLHSLSAGPSAAVGAAFHEGLRDAGNVAGQNVAIEYRWAEGEYNRLPALAADLVSRNVDVIVTRHPCRPRREDATSTILIVFSIVADPSPAVLWTAWPGARQCHQHQQSGTRPMPKRLELVSELAPQARVIALLVNPNLPTMEQLVIVDVQETVNAKGLQLHLLKAGTEGEIDAAFASLAELHRARRRPRSLLSPGRTVRGAGFTHAAPAVYEMRGSAAAGGLISYGTSLPGLIVRPAIYTGFSRVPGRTICLSSNRPHSSW